MCFMKNVFCQIFLIDEKEEDAPTERLTIVYGLPETGCSYRADKIQPLKIIMEFPQP
jgi:hypothetical protein